MVPPHQWHLPLQSGRLVRALLHSCSLSGAVHLRTPARSHLNLWSAWTPSLLMSSSPASLLRPAMSCRCQMLGLPASICCCSRHSMSSRQPQVSKVVVAGGRRQPAVRV